MHLPFNLRTGAGILGDEDKFTAFARRNLDLPNDTDNTAFGFQQPILFGGRCYFDNGDVGGHIELDRGRRDGSLGGHVQGVGLPGSWARLHRRDGDVGVGHARHEGKDGRNR
jgi:hypothetical protein